MKEVRLSEIDRRTMTCALKMFLDAVKQADIDNENVTVMSKSVALISCVNIIRAFDLEDLMEELEDVL